MSKILRRGLATFARNKNIWTSEKEILSPCNEIEIPTTTVHEHVFGNMDRWANKTAVVCGVTKRKYTYEQVHKHSRIFGANLRKKFKIKDGDTVAIMMPNAPEFPIAMYGILAAGGIVTTMNHVYTHYEIQKQLETSRPSVIIAHPDLVPNIRKGLELAKKDIKIITVDLDKPAPLGTISFKELYDDSQVDLDALKEVRRNHDDIAFLLYSSGTTGLPKGVELTHSGVVANCCQQDTELRRYSYTTDSNQDTTLVVLPMFHSYGLNILTLHKMSVGLQLVTLPKFHPDTLLSTLLEYRINSMYLAPPMVLFLGSYPEVTAKHLEGVSSVTSGAAPLPAADIQKLYDKAQRDINFCQGYGLTEAGPLVTIMPMNGNNHESVGYALPNIKMRIVDSDLRNLGPGEVGELLIKGPSLMRGYKDNPEATKNTFVDGWLRTGDMAKVDENGLVWIADRLKELIKVKGFQVPPAELEGVIKEHPEVFDAAVIGVSHPTTGETPKAFIVLKQGSKATEEQIASFVNERVAAYKRVNQIQFIDNIPKSPSGKILKKVLKEMS